MEARAPADTQHPADRTTRDEEIRMTKQFEIEQDKAVVHAFYQAGIDDHLTSFAQSRARVGWVRFGGGIRSPRESRQ
jgi:hypothetical protein